MNGVKFGDYHSYDDFSLILTSKTIGTPSPKTETIDIPGGDGVLDLTEFFGEVKYNNRPLSFEFSTKVPQAEFMDLFSRVQNALHGQKMNIILDDDSEWHYTGRITVSEWKAEKRIGKLTIDCDCEPYKTKPEKTTAMVSLCGRNLLNIDDAISYDSNGTWTKQAIGYMYSRGTATGASYKYYKIPVRKGQKYTYYANKSAGMLEVYKDKLFGELVGSTDFTTVTFTATETREYIFAFSVGANITSALFAQMMLIEGDTVGEYEYYDTSTVTKDVVLQNANRTAIPTLYAKGNVTITKGTLKYAVSSGVYTLSNFPLTTGNNVFSFSGNGHAILEWAEGGL